MAGRLVGVATVVLVGATGCAVETESGARTSSATAPPTITVTAVGSSGVAPAPTTSSAPLAVVPPVTTVPAAAPAPAALMPAVVCMNLQAAQDTIQAAGVFFSRSKDASGRGRAQVMDRNWVVVAQEPAPGMPVGEAEAVLSVVKNDESSQC
ncbi:PASTA domain-containing protein [Nocardia sp. MW-W600-9]